MGYVLGGALLFGAIGLVLKSFVRKKVVGDDDRFDMVWRDRLAAIAIGMFGGFIVGLTSVGSGTFFALTMLFVFPLGAHKIVGTDILHAAALLYVAGFGHFIAGNVDMHAVGWLLIGSIPGVLIGSHYSVRIPEAWLRLALADVLAISGLKLVQVPNVYLAVAIGVSVAAGHRRRRPARGAVCVRRGRSCSSRPAKRSHVKLRGRAPLPLDPARRRVAGRDGGRVRGHAGPEDPAEPDHRAADRRRSSRPSATARRGSPSIQFRLRKPDRVRLEIVDGGGTVVRTLVPGKRLRRGTVTLHLERPRRPGPLRRRRASTSRASTWPTSTGRSTCRTRCGSTRPRRGSSIVVARAADDLAGRRRPQRP